MDTNNILAIIFGVLIFLILVAITYSVYRLKQQPIMVPPPDNRFTFTHKAIY